MNPFLNKIKHWFNSFLLKKTILFFLFLLSLSFITACGQVQAPVVNQEKDIPLQQETTALVALKNFKVENGVLSVFIAGKGVKKMSGMQGDIQFDSHVLDFISLEKEKNIQDFLLTNNKVNDNISFALASGKEQDSIDDAFLKAQFLIKQKGKTNISLQNISVFDAQSNTIPVKTEGVEVVY